MLNFNLQEILEKQKEVVERLSKNKFPLYNVSKDDDGTTIEIGAAGFKAEHFNINFDNKFLSILGEAPKEKMEKGAEYLAKNLSMKPFEIKFPAYVFDGVKGVTYSYEDGILKVVLSKKEESKVSVSFVGEK